MSAVRKTAAKLDRRSKNLRRAQGLQADSRAHYVRDAVCGANFVEMDLLYASAVDFSLGSRDNAKNFACRFFYESA